jgi:hypothetical protein
MRKRDGVTGVLLAWLVGAGAATAQPAPPDAALGMPQPINPAPLTPPPDPLLGSPPPVSPPAIPFPPPPRHPGDIIGGPPAPFCEEVIHPPPPDYLLPAEPLFYFTGELGFVAPVVKNELAGVVTRPNGSMVLVAPPRAELDKTISPYFAIGYEIPEGEGSFELGYRFLITDGTNEFSKSRLDMHVIDFDYVSPRLRPLPRWEFNWFLGARLATSYYDTTFPTPTFIHQASNHFLGGGVHLGLEVEREIEPFPAWALFGRVEGSAVVGRTRQTYTDVSALGTSELFLRESQTIPVFRVEGGIRYRPPAFQQLRFMVGYQFERWWNLGHIGGADLDLTTQGVFLRAEIRY